MDAVLESAAMIVSQLLSNMLIFIVNPYIVYSGFVQPCQRMTLHGRLRHQHGTVKRF